MATINLSARPICLPLVRALPVALVVLLAAPIHAQVQFEDVTTSADFDYWGESWGASWGDLNGDGWPDIFINHHRAPPSLHVNQGDGSFVDITASTYWNNPAVVGDMHGGSWADFDNDGDQDFYVTHGSKNPNHFMVNSGGVLNYQTPKYDLQLPSWRGRLPVWFDFTNDGLLDYLVTSENMAPVAEQVANTFADRTTAAGIDCNKRQMAYLVDVTRDGALDLICTGATFPGRIYDFRMGVPFTQLNGVMPNTGATQDVAIGDFDGNLNNDFFLVRGAKRLSGADRVDANTVVSQLITVGGGEKRAHFVTNGDLTITLVVEREFSGNDVAIGSAGWNPDVPVTKVGGERTMVLNLSSSDPSVVGIQPHNTGSNRDVFIGYDPATQTWTISNSPGGHWTYLYVEVSSTSSISNVTASGINNNDRPIRPVLMSNRAGGFSDVANASGLGGTLQCVSAVTADFDNDMDMDIYAVCRGANLNLANRYFDNDGNGNFSEVPLAGGAAGPVGAGVGKGESVVTADFDVDGNVDLFVTNGLAMNPERIGGPDLLYRNLGHASNRWIQFDLVGAISNRDGIGARVLVTAAGKTQLREQGGGYHRWSQNDKRLHFGLGPNALADVTVEWPSGVVDTYEDVPANSVYKVNEGGQIVEFIAGQPPVVDPPGNPREVPLTDWLNHTGDVTTNGNQIDFSGSANTGWIHQVNSVPFSDLGFDDDFEVRFEIVGNTDDALFVVGLGVDESGSSRTDVDYGFRVANGSLQIRQNGIWMTAVGTISAGDILAISVSSGTIEYRLNGVAVFSSAYSGSPDFYVDSAFKSGSIAINVTVFGDDGGPNSGDQEIVDWVNSAGGVSAAGNALTYSGAPTGWLNSINSMPLSALGAGSGYTVSWTLDSDPSGVNWVVGLGVSETGTERSDVEYGIRNLNGAMEVRQNGFWRANGDTLSIGDKLALRVSETTVEFLLNDTVVHSLSVSGTEDFYIDTAFKNGATQLGSFTLSN